MLVLSQADAPIETAVVRAARREEDEGGSGWLVFSIMMPVLTAFLGYAVGFERGTKKG